MNGEWIIALFFLFGVLCYTAGFSSALNKAAEYGVEFWCDHPAAQFAWVCADDYIFREG